MRACKPRHKEPPARSLMWATAAPTRPPMALRGRLRHKAGEGFSGINYLGDGSRRRGSQRCKVGAIGGEIVESWAGWVRGKGRVVPWCGGPHHCYGMAALLLREPTLYYALHSPGHTHACTATPLFDGNPGRECSPHYQMFARVAKLRVSQNLGGSSFRRRPIKGVADLGSAVLSSSSGTSLAKLWQLWY